MSLTYPGAPAQLAVAGRWMRANAMSIIVIGLVIFLVFVPISRLLISSFQLGHPAFPDGWTTSNYTSAFTTENLYVTLGRTFWIAGVGTAISLSLAILLAWLVERTDMPFRNLAWVIILVPMAIPGILFAMSWNLLLAPNSGAINIFLRSMFAGVGVSMEDGPINVYSVGGLIFLDSIRGVTTIFLMVVGSFRMMDPTLEEAARVSKASRTATFFKVTLPALTPAILAAGMYSFILSMESFEAALAVGLPGGVFVLSTLIYFTTRIQPPPDYGLGAVFGVIFMVIMLFLLILYRYVVRHSDRYSTVTGKGFRPRIISIGKWRYPAFCLFLFYFLIAIVLPFAILLWTSLMPSYRPPSFEVLHLVTLKNFIAVFQDAHVYKVIWNTILLMLISATATMVLAFFVSWMIVRGHGTGKSLLDLLVFIPLAVPGIVIAMALLLAYLTPPLNYLGIYGTIWILVIGLAVSYLPFCTRLMNAAIVQIHKDLEQAARVSGVTLFRTLIFITLPLLLPAFVAGWIWVAVHSLRAFAIPLMLAGRNNQVFAVLLWEYWEKSIPVACAMGVLLILVLIPMTLLLRKFISQFSRQQG
jgi:iron(III) transport system permease protein